MRIWINSVLVDDQEKALRFYTEVLGFAKKEDQPVGGGFRWLTVVSSEDPNGPELLLEPNAHPAAVTYQAAMVQDGIPLGSFAVRDMAAEVERLKSLRVRFHTEPAEVGGLLVSVFDDTCGNLIQLVQIRVG